MKGNESEARKTDLTLNTDPLALMFGTSELPFARLPNILIASAEGLIDKLVECTQGKLGIWKFPIPIDEEGNESLDRIDAHTIPFSTWASDENREKLREAYDRGATQLYGYDVIICDSKTDAEILIHWDKKLYQDPITFSSRIWEELPGFVNEVGWVAIPMTPDRDWLMVVACPAREDSIRCLGNWCIKKGYRFHTIEMKDNRPVLIEGATRYH